MRYAFVALLFIALVFISGCAQYGTTPPCDNAQVYKLRMERDRCWYNRAVLQKDESLCESIYTGNWFSVTTSAIYDVTSGKIKAECFKTVATELAQDYKDSGGVGSPANIANICEKINQGVTNGDVSGNPSFRDDCFYEVAVLTASPDICNGIDADVMVDSSEDVLDPFGQPTGESTHVMKSKRDVCTEDAILASH